MSRAVLSTAICVCGLAAAGANATATTVASASSSVSNFNANCALDGDRFSVSSGWKGHSHASNWWWQVRFEPPRAVGAILQISGDHGFVFQNAPLRFVWQQSDDGVTWSDVAGTKTINEQRLFHLHRLAKVITPRYLRVEITAVAGNYPTLREVEFYPDPLSQVRFPDWIIAVNTTHERALPNHGQEFIPLAKSCDGWSGLQAQQIWLGTFNEAFLRTEPRPLCAFLSGNFKDWCEVNRENWRGTQEVLQNKNLPIWASCGGAQGLAILAETGVDKPWDCPHCRDREHPLTPIYTHIGHTAQRPCGDYSGCIFERGPHWVRRLTDDPTFGNLPGQFEVMESHCGQIEWPPANWRLIVTAGKGSQTKTQCLRMNDRYIYAAQFHIEMAGTQETSRQIMGNFLKLAKAWGGYNPNGEWPPHGE